MWIKAFDGGRVNLEQVVAFSLAGSGSNWAVNARLTDGSTVKILDALTSRADADAAIDALILNGS